MYPCSSRTFLSQTIKGGEDSSQREEDYPLPPTYKYQELSPQLHVLRHSSSETCIFHTYTQYVLVAVVHVSPRACIIIHVCTCTYMRGIAFTLEKIVSGLVSCCVVLCCCVFVSLFLSFMVQLNTCTTYCTGVSLVHSLTFS